MPSWIPGEVGIVLRFGDAGHVDNDIYWCHGTWTINDTPSPDFRSGVSGILNGEIFSREGYDDPQAHFYNYKGHGARSGWTYMRRANFSVCDVTLHVACGYHYYIRQRVYLHGDGTKHVSPMYTNAFWV